MRKKKTRKKILQDTQEEAKRKRLAELREAYYELDDSCLEEMGYVEFEGIRNERFPTSLNADKDEA